MDPDRPLPRGLNLHGFTYRARRPGGPWVKFGQDYAAAIVAYESWKKAKAQPLTVTDLLDRCIGGVWADRVAAGTMRPRTLVDYSKDAEAIKAGLGKCPLPVLAPHHVATFKNTRAKTNPAHVRNELACLSAALSWAVEEGLVTSNVCMQVSRPPKQVRERLISDAEYLAVYQHAIASERLAMLFGIRTLGSPGDVLAMGPRNVVRYQDGRKTLRFRRGKTRVPVEIEIVGELAEALTPLLGSAHPTFVRRRDGKAYTVNGMGAIFRRHCKKAEVTDFGLRDLRAKGATDMYRAGVPLKTIQLLLGHLSVRTTEIYIKQLLTEIVRPNELPIIAAVK